ncbi:MAG: HIT family protein, partial [Lachnospiraceae bacterium]|nr:HIT family protein [Lachnospiraceae bacterium]
CIFCKIGKGDIPSATVYENSDFKVFMDLSPANKGHVLIIPKEHYDNIFQIDAETAGKLFSLATAVARAVKAETKCEGMNVVQNNGAVAGQTVNHFHLHLIPRFEGDGVSVTWKQGETEPDELQALAKAIRKHI